MATFEVWYCNECGRIVSHAEIDRPDEDITPHGSTAAIIVAKVPTMTVYPCEHRQGASRERPTL